MTKRLLDVVLALLGLVVLLPLAVVLALLIVLDSRGRVLYRSRRVGRGGREFAMLKFRTMRTGAVGPDLTARDDERITRLGRVLRRTHLDEWPQLWNVLRGKMSLVGPRPESPEFVDFGDARWQQVLSVRPGITGPTQLVFAARERKVLRAADAERVYREELLPQKLASDVAYVERRSLGLDLACLLRTLFGART